jgi:hypothetical protein
MNKLKPLNRQSVRMAATMLMLAEGNTSTLKVKSYLRDHGFRAGQSEVSSWLFRIATREGWTINDNGAVRSYHFPNIMALPLSALSGGSTIARSAGSC